MGLLRTLKNRRRYNLQTLSEIIDETARRHLVTLTFLMAASDGTVDDEEIDEIIAQLGTLWHPNSIAVERWLGASITAFVAAMDQGREKREIVQEMLLDSLEQLRERLNDKQKKELTHYLISVMHADGVVDPQEREMLITYREHIGIDQGFFGALKRGISGMFATRCPACDETRVSQVSRQKIGTTEETQRRTVQYNGRDYSEKRTIKRSRYRITLQCDTCKHRWSRQSAETKTGAWKRKTV